MPAPQALAPSIGSTIPRYTRVSGVSSPVSGAKNRSSWLRRSFGPARCSQSTVRPEFSTAKFAIRTMSSMSRASYIGHVGNVP